MIILEWQCIEHHHPLVTIKGGDAHAQDMHSGGHRMVVDQIVGTQNQDGIPS
jgi:hypothetical protein